MSDDLKLFLAEKVIEKQKEKLAVLLARHNALMDAITPSAETKAAYMGEFSFCTIEFDDEGEEFAQVIDVPWTSIKDIMKAIRERAGMDKTVEEGK